MNKEVERNQRPSLLDDIGRMCPEIKPKIAGIRPPPGGPYAAAQLYPWLCSLSVKILGIVLHLGRRALQEALDAYVDGLDRPEVDVVGATRPCPCTKCGSPVWHYNGRERRKKDFYHSRFDPDPLTGDLDPPFAGWIDPGPWGDHPVLP